MATYVTPLGTPCARGWSREWIVQVEAVEAELGRRICGAIDGGCSPCLLASTHASGRCGYHGGITGAGAPAGNENARVHGLYQRRLRRCGADCPMWESCPYPTEDVLKLPLRNRPTCPFEKDEYEALLKFYFRATALDEDETGEESEERYDDLGLEKDVYAEMAFGTFEKFTEPFLLHDIIMLRVMLTRASVALAHTPMTEDVTVESSGYKMTSRKVSAALDAFVRLMREYRTLRAAIDTKKLLPKQEVVGYATRYYDFAIETAGIAEAAIAETQRREKLRLEEEQQSTEGDGSQEWEEEVRSEESGP